GGRQKPLPPTLASDIPAVGQETGALCDAPQLRVVHGAYASSAGGAGSPAAESVRQAAQSARSLGPGTCRERSWHSANHTTLDAGGPDGHAQILGIHVTSHMLASACQSLSAKTGMLPGCHFGSQADGFGWSTVEAQGRPHETGYAAGWGPVELGIGATQD